MLVTDAEAKHFHEIKKHYAKSYEKFIQNSKTGRYLLIKIESENDDNGIYLPKGVKIVHFGELDWGNQSYSQVTNAHKIHHAQSEGGIDLDPQN